MQQGCECGSKGILTVGSHYQATPVEDKKCLCAAVQQFEVYRAMKWL
jgi:hypothetical protein